jgi:uncharacterized protein (DUF1697 family)
MTYLALLRGINVGGKNIIPMTKLATTFEQLGFENVKTYIASGNIVFTTDVIPYDVLTKQIETAIEQGFCLQVPVLIRDLPGIQKLMEKLPEDWDNDTVTKCDIMFLWPVLDKPDVVKQIPFNPDVETVDYLPGAVVWRIGRENVNRGKVLRIIGTDTYKQVTIRTPGTVRKLYALMQIADKSSS